MREQQQQFMQTIAQALDPTPSVSEMQRQERHDTIQFLEVQLQRAEAQVLRAENRVYKLETKVENLQERLEQLRDQNRELQAQLSWANLNSNKSQSPHTVSGIGHFRYGPGSTSVTPYQGNYHI